MAGGRVRLAAHPKPSLAGASRWQALVGPREERPASPLRFSPARGWPVGMRRWQAGQLISLLVREMVGQWKEDAGFPLEVLAGGGLHEWATAVWRRRRTRE